MQITKNQYYILLSGTIAYFATQLVFYNVQVMNSAFTWIIILISTFLISKFIHAFRKNSNPATVYNYLNHFLAVYIVFVVFSFTGAVYNKNAPESAIGSTNYSTLNTYHCSWCGKEYSHTGYLHVANQCVHPEKDIGIDACCSEKCCYESWNATN